MLNTLLSYPKIMAIKASFTKEEYEDIIFSCQRDPVLAAILAIKEFSSRVTS